MSANSLRGLDARNALFTHRERDSGAYVPDVLVLQHVAIVNRSTAALADRRSIATFHRITLRSCS